MPAQIVDAAPSDRCLAHLSLLRPLKSGSSVLRPPTREAGPRRGCIGYGKATAGASYRQLSPQCLYGSLYRTVS